MQEELKLSIDEQKECKVCKQIKSRINSGTFDGVNKKWVDEKGKQWSGRTCPDCHRIKTRENMQRLRKVVNG